MNELQLEKEPIKKLFFKFTIPAVIAMVLAGSQTMIDGIFLGNYVGTLGLASMNIVQPYVQVIMAVGIIVGLGALSIIGRALGAKNVTLAQDTFKTSLMLITVFALIYGLTGIVFADKMAFFLGADQSLHANVVVYIRNFSLFLPMLPLMVLMGFANRVIGNPSLYLKATIVSLLVNVSLDFLLINTFSLGMQGAALATGIAYAVGMLMTLLPLLKKEQTLSVLKGKLALSTIGPTLYNGSSEGVASVATALTTYLFNQKLLALAGADGVAAFTVISYLVNFGTLLIFGVADGISPLISYNFGNGNFKRVRETIKYGVIAGYLIGTTMALVLFFQSEGLIRMIAGKNESVIQIAASGGVIYSMAFLINSINILGSVYFTSLGNAKASIVIAASRGIVFIVLGIAILPTFLGIAGVWLTVPLSELLTIFVVWVIVKANPMERSYQLQYAN